MKGSGKPDDRKGHVRFEAAGAGDGFTVRLVRHRQTKGTQTDRHHLRDTAPVLDPTYFDILAQEIVEDLEAALEQFREIATDLGRKGVEPEVNRDFRGEDQNEAGGNLER